MSETGKGESLSRWVERGVSWLADAAWPVWLERGVDWQRGAFLEDLDPETLRCSAPFRRSRRSTR